jgi:hypothetical protein
MMRLYSQIKKLDTPAGTDRSEINLHDLSYGRFGFSKFIKSSRARGLKANSGLKQPPWKANNSNPNHFYRFNYLDDEDNVKQLGEKMFSSFLWKS